MVARRAHNPEVVWFKSHLRNQTQRTPSWVSFAFVCGGCRRGLHAIATSNSRFGQAEKAIAERSKGGREPAVTACRVAKLWLPSPTSAAKNERHHMVPFTFACRDVAVNHMQSPRHKILGTATEPCGFPFLVLLSLLSLLIVPAKFHHLRVRIVVF